MAPKKVVKPKVHASQSPAQKVQDEEAKPLLCSESASSSEMEKKHNDIKEAREKEKEMKEEEIEKKETEMKEKEREKMTADKEKEESEPGPSFNPPSITLNMDVDSLHSCLAKLQQTQQRLEGALHAAKPAEDRKSRLSARKSANKNSMPEAAQTRRAQETLVLAMNNAGRLTKIKEEPVILLEDIEEAEARGTVNTQKFVQVMEDKRLYNIYVAHHMRSFPVRARLLMESRRYELCYNFFGVASCVVLGLQAQVVIDEDFARKWDKSLRVIDATFTALFLLHVILLFSAFGHKVFDPRRSNTSWNIMDLFLVLLGISIGWAVDISGQLNTSASARFFEAIRVLRLSRIMRLPRVLPGMHEMWILIRGMYDTFRFLVSTIVVLVAIHFVFAVIGIPLIAMPIKDLLKTNHDHHEQEELQKIWSYVGGMWEMMYTLVMFMSQDSIHFQREVWKFEYGSWFYFLVFQSTTRLLVSSVVTSLIVDIAMEASKGDQFIQLKQKAAKDKAELAVLSDLFERIDKDGSGALSLEEFTEAFKVKEVVDCWKVLNFDISECLEIFALLDDGDGEIETQEFFEGLQSMKGRASSKDLFKISKQLLKLKSNLEQIQQHRSTTRFQNHLTP